VKNETAPQAGPYSFTPNRRTNRWGCDREQAAGGNASQSSGQLDDRRHLPRCAPNSASPAPSRGGGSHYKVSHPKLAAKLTISIQTAYKGDLHTCLGQVRRRREADDMKSLRFPVIVEPLSTEDGGGFLATVPDLPGGMSDGATPEEALANVRDAIAVWIEAAEDQGHAVPEPSRKLAPAG
jgi:antitoxin HicB